MPIYEYICSKCDGKFEIIHGMSERPKTKCPECSGRMKRQVSLGAFHLKGSGWYKDGYANGGNGKTISSDSDKKPKTKAKETATSNKEKGKSESTKSSAPATT